MNKELLRKTLEQFVEYCGEEPSEEYMVSSDKNIFVYPTAAGMLESRVTPVGVFTLPATDVYLTGEINDDTSNFIFRLPKIPRSILDQTVSLFEKFISRSDAIGSSTLEAFVQVFWNREAEEYFIHVPKQVVSTVKVDYVNDQEIIKNNVFVMDIHSHNNMSAFFSGTDDRDEKSSRLYGVIGMMCNEYPDASFRMGVGGRYKYLDVSDIFETDEEFCPTAGESGKNTLVGINREFPIPSEWEKKISVRDDDLRELINKLKGLNKRINRYEEVEATFPDPLERNRFGSYGLQSSFDFADSWDVAVQDELDYMIAFVSENTDASIEALAEDMEYDFFVELLYELKSRREDLFEEVIEEFRR